jgi:hypothetical protein
VARREERECVGKKERRGRRKEPTDKPLYREGH